MTDHELATFLGIADWPDWQRAVDILTPLQRATYERMSRLCIQLELYEAGIGPRPKDVLIDGPRNRSGSPKRRKPADAE